MAEEILYEEGIADNGDDPKDPLGLRKKLKQKADPLGLRAKVQETFKAPDYKIDISQPKRTPAPVTGSRDFSMERDLSKPETMTLNVGGQPKQIDLGVERARSNASKAQEKITAELLNNDDVLERIIRQQKAEVANRSQMEGQLGQVLSDMPSVESAAMQVDRRVPAETSPQNEIVTPRELIWEKRKLEDDPLRARNILEKIVEFKPDKKNEIQASIYELDAASSLGDDEVSGRRVNKIEENIEGLKKGTLLYDARSGRVFKPENIFQSAVTGWKNKTQLFSDYDKFKKTENNDAIAMDLDARRNERDPDAPIPVPEGALGEIGAMAGGTPAKAILAGAAGGLAGPEGAAWAGGIVGGREFAKLQYASTFQQVYYELRDQGVDGFQAVTEARKQADQAAEVGFLTGAAMGVVGARMGIKPLPRVALNEGFRKAVIGSLKNIGSTISGATKEGLALGGVAAAGQKYLNHLAKDAGIDRDLDEGAAESVESMLLFSLGMAAVVRGSKAFSPKTYRTIVNGVSRADNGYINQHLQQMVNEGQITVEQAAKAFQDIVDFKKQDAAIPPNVAPEARVEIQDHIEKRGQLEKRLETEDKAFHPEIKEKIKAIDEQIVEKSKNKAEKEPKDQTGLKKLIESEIEDGNIQGPALEYLKGVHPEELPEIMKDIADQAHDPFSANEAVVTFGEAIVNKAKEMFPKEPPKPSSISVIRPEERVQPTETVTIAPKEKGVPEYKITTEKGVSKGDIVEGKELIASGSESTVYRDGDSVIKIGEEYSEPSTFDARVEDARIISDVLGDGSVELIGTHKSKSGTHNPIFRQKFIEGERATPEQIDAFMESKGFKKKGNGYENEQYRFTDIDPDNVIVDKDGNVHVIDAGVRKLSPKEEGAKIESEYEPDFVFGEEATGTNSQTESQPSGKEKVGITHAQMDEISKELGVETYQEAPETIAQWDAQAKERFDKDPQALDKLFDKLRNGVGVDKVETRMMIQYMADLKAKINKEPSQARLDQYKRARDLFNISGREKGKELRARQGEVPVEETLADYYINDQEANRGPLTEKQKETAKEQYEAVQNAKAKFEAAAEKAVEKKAETKAKAEIEKLKKESKKDAKKDYKQEQKDIVDDIRAKLKKHRGDTLVGVPYVKELIAIAPDVMKLVKSLVDHGISELPAVVKAVHDEIKYMINGITEKDVHNIIAGEYNQKKPKRSDIAEKVFDLKTEAKLINQLEALEAGIEPKSENKKKERNRKIEELKQKIKEHPLTSLAEYKKRVARQIAEVEKQLKDGDFAKEEKEGPVLDEEALKLRDEYQRLKDEREIYKMKLQLDARPQWQKNLDIVGRIIRTGKVLKSSFDVSFLGRQTIVGVARQLFSLPKKNANGQWEFRSQRELKQQIAGMYRSFGSDAVHKRIMADIKQNPRFETSQKAGLKMSDPNSPLSAFQEEAFGNSLIDYIPDNAPIANIPKKGVKASNRAASAISNQMKWDIYTQFVEGFEQKGMTFKNSPDAYKEAAKYANQVVGRGFLGQKVEMANPVTSPIFWSLRLQASRLQLMTKFLTPSFYLKAPPEIRIAYFKDMAKFVATGISILALANKAGAEVELDPRSADFGTIKVGNTRYDIWGGFKQYAVLFSRIVSGGQKKSSGQIEELRGMFAKDLKYGEKTRADVLGRFVRTKLTPEVGLGLDILSGEGFDKKPITPGKAAVDFVTPLIYKDFTEALKDGGVQKAIATSLLSIHGIGAITYAQDEQKSSGKPTRKGKKTNKKTVKK